MLSISQNVRVSFCLSVRVFTFDVPFKRLFATIHEVGCLIVLEIRNPWGKVMERRRLTFENFNDKGCKIAAHFFLRT